MRSPIVQVPRPTNFFLAADRDFAEVYSP